MVYGVLKMSDILILSFIVGFVSGIVGFVSGVFLCNVVKLIIGGQNGTIYCKTFRP